MYAALIVTNDGIAIGEAPSLPRKHAVWSIRYNDLALKYIPLPDKEDWESPDIVLYEQLFMEPKWI